MQIEQHSERADGQSFHAVVLADDGFRYVVDGQQGQAGRWQVAVGRNDDTLMTLEFASKPMVQAVLDAVHREHP